VELERFVPSGRHVSGVSDRGLSRVSFPGLVGWKHYAIAVAVIALDRLHQRARHPDGRPLSRQFWKFPFSCRSWRCARSRQRSGTTIHLCRWCRRMFRRSRFSGWGWRWVCGCTPATSRCPALRGSRKSAAELSDRTRDRHSTVHCNVFSADDVLARRAGRLGEMAYRIFFRCRVADRRALAGFCDDRCGHDHQSFAAERHGADQHAHAIHDGGGRLPSEAFSRATRRYGTPWIAIIVSSIIYALLRRKRWCSF